MEESVHLASLVQKQFKNTCKRVDRGVHQAGFLVLKASAMPSILVELGFISNREEERYLNSEEGSATLANGIYRAFLSYKREQELKRNGSSHTTLPEAAPASQQRPTAVPKGTTAERMESGVIFKVQILTSPRPLAQNDKRLKGVKAEYYREGGLYKYVCGASANYDQVLRTKQGLSKKFKDAFIVAFKNGKKTDAKAAIKAFNNEKAQ